MGLYTVAVSRVNVTSAVHWQREICAYLADRDGDRCAICHQMVDLKIRSGTRGSDAGPSIDHVIPRSRGGSDDLANLRLTHWGCNRKRGNRGGYEQLRLIG
ncbi:MAG: HNH endonuclease [Gammaproteobacteria bacterium]|nr:HNH endonuclease [Gammaproteobacteria bacterium]